MYLQSVAGHLDSFDYLSWVFSGALGLTWAKWAILILFHLPHPLVWASSHNKAEGQEKEQKHIFKPQSASSATVPLTKASHMGDLRVIV